MKLSVVIPVYHVEATLDRCVSSVLSQDVSDMEVILVDDGSDDRCPQMCDRWAVTDRRIQVVHQANGGLSDARNTGIDRATGDCITFVDSDDWLADGTYGPLLDLMDGCDILEYPVAGRLQLSDRRYTDANDYWLTERAYQHTYVWNKIFRRRMFDGVRFPKGRIFEDAFTLPRLLRQASAIFTASHGAYHYAWNAAGITATADGYGLAQLLEAHLSSGMPLTDDYYLCLLNIQMDVWERTMAPLVLPERKLNSSLFSGRNKLKAILFNLLGIKRLCRINKFIHHFRKPSR
jgi:glycosyltransferase involved in cell wall biosynthesis